MRSAARSAFTLTELLVVTAIIVVLLAIALPSFRTILYDTEAVLAESRLDAGIRAARSAALSQPDGEDVVLAFLFEPGEGTRLVVCAEAGQITEVLRYGNVGPEVVMDVFAPLSTVQPIDLPQGWVVRGFVAPDYITRDWYDGAGSPGGGRHDFRQPHWLFPESGFYDRRVLRDGSRFSGDNRQSFVMRFKGGTGELVTSNASMSLVIDPSPVFDRDGWGGGYPALYRDFNIQRATDLRTFARTVLQRVPTGSIGSGTQTDRTSHQLLLGIASPDTVQVRAVPMVALYDERRLAAAFGVSLDDEVGAIYKNPRAMADPEPDYLDVLGDDDEVARRVTKWINGDTANPSDGDYEDHDFDENDRQEARIFRVDRFAGGAIEVPVQPVSEN